MDHSLQPPLYLLWRSMALQNISRVLKENNKKSKQKQKNKQKTRTKTTNTHVITDLNLTGTFDGNDLMSGNLD